MSDLFGAWGQRLAAYSAAGFFVYLMGIQIDSILPWALLIMVIVLEYLAYFRGIEDGIVMYRNLTPAQKTAIDQMMDETDES